MKTETWTLCHGLALTALLAAGCGSSPPDSSATGGQSSTGTATSDPTTSGDLPTTQGSNSNSNSDSDPVTEGGMSAGQTEATTGTDTGTMTAGITSTDTDTTTTSPVTSDTDTTTDPGTSDTSTTSTTGPDTSTTDTTTTAGTSTSGTSDTTTTDGTTTDQTTGDALECGLQLKATIRDFKLPHPDFETYCCGVVPGLVKPDLGPDKKPVFNQPGNPKMLTDAPTFDQWYNNVKDINQSTQIVLDLQEVMPGVYSYQNNSFFPIDNQLFGNQGNNHNFHFTTEIHTAFTYNGGETFTFTGDDDVWVFINKKLVIDIGGVHGNTAANVKLDTLGLTVGVIYSLDVFHAERHTTQSNFRIDTTICSVPQ